MNRLLTLLVIGLAFLLLAPPAEAFCGFYVAQADSSLYNQASQVAIARHGNHTVLTMANDYQGDVSEFALVVPVPTVIEPEQVQIADPAILQRLDRFSAPRLVYYPETIAPCSELQYLLWPYTLASGGIAQLESRRDQAASALGVTVESRFSRGEYDILVLSAEESDGLETWLRQNGYRLPEGASQVLKPYIRQGMKFFVARVNLAEFDRLGYQTLRPLPPKINRSRPRASVSAKLAGTKRRGPVIATGPAVTIRALRAPGDPRACAAPCRTRRARDLPAAARAPWPAPAPPFAPACDRRFGRQPAHTWRTHPCPENPPPPVSSTSSPMRSRRRRCKPASRCWATPT